MEQTRAVVLLSGGIDSAASVVFLREQGFAVEAMFVDYGQASAVQERMAVERLSTYLNCPVQYLSVMGQGKFASGELQGRNAFLIFSALFAARGKYAVIAIGIHAGTPYFDCSRAFFSRVHQLICESTDATIALLAPFLDWAKSDVYRYFCESGIPIALTYSCESGLAVGCGTCLSCRDRGTYFC